MLLYSNGKIFLASERGRVESRRFRTCCMFNFGTYESEHKRAFGLLYVFNEDTLGGGQHFIHFVETDSNLILIPTAGAVQYKDNAGNETRVEAGQMQWHTVRRGTTFELSNPYKEALINFIQIRIKHKPAEYIAISPALFSFHPEQLDNTLHQVIPGHNHESASFKITLGNFGGRKEAVYKPACAQNGLFFFVLQGVFEVQHRLLESKDGLALWELEEAEMEALSNDALVLIIETTLS